MSNCLRYKKERRSQKEASFWEGTLRWAVHRELGRVRGWRCREQLCQTQQQGGLRTPFVLGSSGCWEQQDTHVPARGSCLCSLSRSEAAVWEPHYRERQAVGGPLIDSACLQNSFRRDSASSFHPKRCWWTKL